MFCNFLTSSLKGEGENKIPVEVFSGQSSEKPQNTRVEHLQLFTAYTRLGCCWAEVAKNKGLLDLDYLDINFFSRPEACGRIK